MRKYIFRKQLQTFPEEKRKEVVLLFSAHALPQFVRLFFKRPNTKKGATSFSQTSFSLNRLNEVVPKIFS